MILRFHGLPYHYHWRLWSPSNPELLENFHRCSLSRFRVGKVFTGIERIEQNVQAVGAEVV